MSVGERGDYYAWRERLQRMLQEEKNQKEQIDRFIEETRREWGHYDENEYGPVVP